MFLGQLKCCRIISFTKDRCRNFCGMFSETLFSKSSGQQTLTTPLHMSLWKISAYAKFRFPKELYISRD